MQEYAGVPTDQERSDMESLRKRLSSGILFLMFGDSRAMLARADTRYAGRVSEEALEARIGGVDARLPWQAVTAHASTSAVILLLAGQLCLPIARSFFATEEAWQLARQTIETKVPSAPTDRSSAVQWKTIVLWLALLVVIFLAWHFAQPPGAR